MSSEKKSKINQVLKHWPFGVVATLTWLKGFGVSQQLAHKYEKSNWIESLGSGAYKRDEDSVIWDGAIHALQFQLQLPIHIAGITALALQGRAQYLPIGERVLVCLRGQRGTTIPRWFKNNDWKADIKIGFKTSLPVNPQYLNEIKINGSFPVKVACSELAILEYVEGVNDSDSFMSARELMEGMIDLRVKVLQELLEKCSSIRVKRIFLYLAEQINLPWPSKLDKEKIDLGVGKRVIVKGGSFNSKYAITVPRDLEVAEESIF